MKARKAEKNKLQQLDKNKQNTNKQNQRNPFIVNGSRTEEMNGSCRSRPRFRSTEQTKQQ